ncbi:hypothetical protein V1634_01780 [Plantactinospora veratri]|uniref:Uncharacterized protein n=1 Tax=Plantactinospora veratri TaxID=1436122 RepID=A0ABU7S6S6_9ACTN
MSGPRNRIRSISSASRVPGHRPRYAPEQLAVLFDYFARAAPAFTRATEEIRRTTAERRRRR